MATDAQFYGDIIEQLDLALEQLTLRDKNFDRFAIMLVDNATELFLHRYARSVAARNRTLGNLFPPTYDPRIVRNALGQNFDDKIRLAKHTGLLTEEIGQTLMYLHEFRNTAYHAGKKHDGILNALTLLQMRHAINLMKQGSSRGWSWGSNDVIPDRTEKYLTAKSTRDQAAFGSAWQNLLIAVEGQASDLVSDLSADMQKTIEAFDGTLDYVTEENHERKDKIIEIQAWDLAFTDAGKQYAAENNCPEDQTVAEYVAWLGANYSWPVRDDPVKFWQKRLTSLRTEKDLDKALKKYCDFMKQTEVIRSQLEEHAIAFEQMIDQQIDEMRESRS